MSEMTFGNNTLRKVNFKNILSFGDKGLGEDGSGLEMKPLNVLIGANGSGKSNFLSCLRLIAASVDAYDTEMMRRGRSLDWLNNNSGDKIGIFASYVETAPQQKAEDFAEHFVHLKFDEFTGSVSIIDEKINSGWIEVYSHSNNRNMFTPQDFFQDNDGAISIFASSSMPDDADVRFLLRFYKGIRLYEQWVFGYENELRKACDLNMPSTYLMEDFSNLVAVLAKLTFKVEIKDRLLCLLEKFGKRFSDFQIDYQNGLAVLYLREGKTFVPISRLSDGTIRFLCLCTLLLTARLPLICLEEPELGMHPDIIPTIAELIKEASQRTQLVVTTHSPILVDCLSDVPESIVVCEREENYTTMKRLEPEKVKDWLKDYSLGQVWTSGEIGGNRW